MNRHRRAFVLATANLPLLAACGGGGSAGTAPDAVPSPDAESLSAYDTAVMADAPVLFLPMAAMPTGREPDLAGTGLNGIYKPATGLRRATSMPNGDPAAVFDGHGQYLEFPDTDALSVPTTGVLSIEAWLRPDATHFPRTEGSGYVHWMGKGEIAGPGVDEDEWAARIYSRPNDEDRENRISGYAFNPDGGLGAGSYFQEPVTPGEWIHFLFVINARNTSSRHPLGYTRIYRNGELRDTDSLAEYDIRPRNGAAPLRIGTRAGKSFFLGAIGKVAVYDHELTGREAMEHYQLMCDSCRAPAAPARRD